MSKIDDMRIAGTQYDRRVKLTDAQRVAIRERYATGEISTYGLAKEYNVSRRTIDFILHPDRYKQCQAQFKERRKDGRYAPTREERTAIMREHRQYKRALLNKK